MDHWPNLPIHNVVVAAFCGENAELGTKYPTATGLAITFWGMREHLANWEDATFGLGPDGVHLWVPVTELWPQEGKPHVARHIERLLDEGGEGYPAIALVEADTVPDSLVEGGEVVEIIWSRDTVHSSTLRQSIEDGSVRDAIDDGLKAAWEATVRDLAALRALEATIRGDVGISTPTSPE